MYTMREPRLTPQLPRNTRYNQAKHAERCYAPLGALLLLLTRGSPNSEMLERWSAHLIDSIIIINRPLYIVPPAARRRIAGLLARMPLAIH